MKTKIEKSRIDYLVFEGGGGKGNAFVGCIQALEDYVKKTSGGRVSTLVSDCKEYH